MSEPIELRILQGNGENIFTGNDKYVIPLYQRAYAWGSRQLKQLVEDISDFDSDKYYIGTLIVSRNGDTFEVIDGQQRLTSLYLLLTCLGIDIHENLSFARRDRSNYTLKNIAKVIRDDESLEKTMLEGTIIDGLETLKETEEAPPGVLSALLAYAQAHVERQLRSVKLLEALYTAQPANQDSMEVRQKTEDDSHGD